MSDKKIGIDSVIIEDELAGEHIYDVLGGSLQGASKAIRDFASKLDPDSNGANLLAHVRWADSNFTLSASIDVTKDLEFFSDFEIEKYLLDSINLSIARDFCDPSCRALGQLDYSWDNHISTMCSSASVHDLTMNGILHLCDGKHEGIRPPVIHPQIARTLVKEGLLELSSDEFLKFMPRETLSNAFKSYNEFLTQHLRQHQFDAKELSFDCFYRKEYLDKFLSEPERQGEKEVAFARG